MGLARIDEQFTQEDGMFSFTLEETSDEYIYYLSASADHYFSSAPHVNVDVGKKNENMRLPITPRGYVKFIISDELPKDTLTRLAIGGFNIEPINYLDSDTFFIGA